MRKILNNEVTLFIITLLFWSTATFADDPDFPIDGDPGEPAAPIDSWMPFMIIIAILTVFYYTHKIKRINN